MSVKPTVQTRKKLYQELLNHVLLLPTPGHLEESTHEPLKEIQVVTQPSPEGKLCWLAFTSQEALYKWKHENAYVAIQGSQLFELALRNKVDNILMNVAGPIGGLITRIEIQMLAQEQATKET